MVPLSAHGLRRSAAPRRRLTKVAVQLRRYRALLLRGRSALRSPWPDRRRSHRTIPLVRLSPSGAGTRAHRGALRGRVETSGTAPLPHGLRHERADHGRSASGQGGGRPAHPERRKERSREPRPAARAALGQCSHPHRDQGGPVAHQPGRITGGRRSGRRERAAHSDPRRCVRRVRRCSQFRDDTDAVEPPTRIRTAWRIRRG